MDNTIINMNNSQTVIGLNEVVEKCQLFLSQEITLEEFKEWASHIYLKKYLPLNIKFMIINNILFVEQFTNIDNNALISTQLELQKFYLIALAYTNIVVEDYVALQTMENYDIIMSSLGDLIFQYINTDYNRTIDLLHNIMNFNNISKIFDTLNNIVELPNMAQDLQNTFKVFEANKGTMNNILDIIKFNNGTKNINDK